MMTTCTISKKLQIRLYFLISPEKSSYVLDVVDIIRQAETDKDRLVLFN